MNIKKLNKIIISAIICVIFFSLASFSVNGEEQKKYGDLYYNEFDEDKDGINDCVDIVDCDKDVVTVNIPAKIDGLPIKYISTRFHYRTSLTDINVAEDNAEFCSIDGVLFNKDHTQLIKYPLGKTSSEYSIPEGTETIMPYAFSSSRLEKVDMPDSITVIDDHSFMDCQSLTDIKLSKNLKRIENYSFNGCKITDIKIPRSVSAIGTGAFLSCENFSKISVATGNLEFCSIGGVLFNKDKTELLIYPQANKLSEYNIPNGVTTIGEYAFSCCKTLENITIPESVTQIMKDAFSCTNLKSIIIPKNVVSIGSMAFDECKNMEKVIIYNPDCSISGTAFLECSGAIYAEENSEVQKYAESDNVNMPFEAAVKGDADSSGKFDIRDARFIAVMCAKKTKFLLPPWSDYNGDEKYSIKDAADIAKYLANSKFEK